MSKRVYYTGLLLIAVVFTSIGIGFKLWTQDILGSNKGSDQAIKAYKIEKSRNGLSLNSIKEIEYNNIHLSIALKKQLAESNSACAVSLSQRIASYSPNKVVLEVMKQILLDVNNYEQNSVEDIRTTFAWNENNSSCPKPIVFEHVKNEEGVFLLKDICQLNLYYDCACED